jgi:hypothetical protein
MKKGKIVFRLLLPSHENAARATPPGMRSFDDPTACVIAWNDLFFYALLPTAAHMRPIVTGHKLFIDRGRIIGSIQTELFSSLSTRPWPSNDESIKSGAK